MTAEFLDRWAFIKVVASNHPLDDLRGIDGVNQKGFCSTHVSSSFLSYSSTQIPLALIVGCPVGILWPRFASLPTNEEATVSNQESADASSNG